MKLDADGKRVSIPDSMCQKALGKLLVVNSTPFDIHIAQGDPSYKGAAHRPRRAQSTAVKFIAAQICLMPSSSSAAAALRA